MISGCSCLTGFRLAVQYSREEVLGQPGNVPAALAQGRNHDGDNVDPIKQVLAKPALFHLRFQIVVGSGNEAEINLLGSSSPQPLHRLLLKSAQQFALQPKVEGRNLVQKKRAGMCQLDQPGLALSAPVKAPFSYPKSSDSISVSGRAEQFRHT